MTVPAPELLPLRALEAFLDAEGLGSGPPEARRIGHGASNLTYLVERDGARVVLRRPPPPPLPPSAHDIVREARIQVCLARGGVRVPEILAVCEDEAVIGAPFYLMAEVVGALICDSVPRELDTPEERRRLGFELVDALAELHAVDWRSCGLETLGKPTGYLERQLRRWSGLWEVNATRDLGECLEIGEQLKATMPASPPATVVHGDYRFGNVMVGVDAPARLVAILDWEMATLGDPLADLGYLVVSWSEPGAPEHPLLLSPVTSRPGFPSRAELIDRYAQRTGHDVSRLRWYEAFALWKASVFCEAIYGRYLRGERDDPWAGALCDGVPRLLQVARALL
ncbi:MAG TPA: phosphotransferase family protein [Solirubrobacteraceae bacterium]|nr:phosphotransferase family protein [Solirubrobacteraceae bacterium]